MSFKYEVLGQVRFGNELEDILKLKGITDINSFLNPTVENTEMVDFQNTITSAVYEIFDKFNEKYTLPDDFDDSDELDDLLDEYDELSDN